MAKLSILVPLALLLLASFASARQQWELQGDRCEEQLDRANLRPCEQHLMQKIQQDQDEDEYDRYNPRHSGSSQHKQRCCNELNEFENNQRCMCQALQQIMENQSDRLQGRQQEKQFERELRNLPQHCGIRAPQRCNLDVEDRRNRF
ncbi:Conglutin-7 [Stylosanthes scabra]|uniref:Conglutin-7 n=1 Tax=Stylosanthes scabra TaxID=79078 RepID=A0ABU6X325_9FABA|nr:Conglutin-7 [Stylosanthes scabra]